MRETTRTSPSFKKIPDLRNSFTRIATARVPDPVLHVNSSTLQRVRPVRTVAIGGGEGLSLLLCGLERPVAPRPGRDPPTPPGDPAAGLPGYLDRGRVR